jgi:predicted deacylase
MRVENVSDFPECVLKIIRILKDKDLPPGKTYQKRPVIVVAARIHPGETNGSFAIEGLMNFLFSNHRKASMLRTEFSFLIIPMINVDGVICGLYRPNLFGDDLNRIWEKPDSQNHPEVRSILHMLTNLFRNRPIAFCIDFHGHSAAYNSFTYGFMNEESFDLEHSEKFFPIIMSKLCDRFDYKMCNFGKSPEFEGTMRVDI